MKHCPNCTSEIVDEPWICGRCAWRAPIRDGITLLSEVPEGRNENYDPVYFEQLAALEGKHFWFRSRNDLIESFAKRYLRLQSNYLEIGCGTGFVLRHLRTHFSQWTISASELHHAGLLFARSRVPEGVQFMQLNAQAIPFRSEFDVIGAFDVVEHIQDDRGVLRQIHQALRPGGHVLVTVPQHMWLWSRYDEIGCHFRRYTRVELRDKLREAGFEIVREASFNSFLIPAMFISRLISFRRNRLDADALEELKLSRAANAVLGFILRLEVLLTTRLGIDWPLGGSRIVLARKAESSAPRSL